MTAHFPLIGLCSLNSTTDRAPSLPSAGTETDAAGLLASRWDDVGSSIGSTRTSIEPHFPFEFPDNTLARRSPAEALSGSHPEFSSEDDDFSSGLFLPEPPLHQVLPVFSRQRHVASGYSRVSSTYAGRPATLLERKSLRQN